MLKLSLCTISFRHHLIGIPEIAAFAQSAGFDEVELWGAHAEHLAELKPYGARWLAQFGLSASMVSHYLPLVGDAATGRRALHAALDLCERWGAPKLRLFAHNQASAAVDDARFAAVAERLREFAEIASGRGLTLAVETHPGTLADSLAATQRLLAAVPHPALTVNFDVLHLWEAGDDPAQAFAALAPRVSHLHLKNIASSEQLGVFAPANVYSPAGDRAGMVPMGEGAFDYRAFLHGLAPEHELSASLEWFGGRPRAVLSHDVQWLRTVLGAGRRPMSA